MCLYEWFTGVYEIEELSVFGRNQMVLHLEFVLLR